MPGDLLQRRLVVVTGKGGVGKSTVAAALAVVAARRGKRVVVAEVGRRGDVLSILDPAASAPAGDPPSDDGRFDERTIDGPWDGSLAHVSVSPEAALREYLRDQLPLGPLADVLHSSRVFTGLTAATPGMRELLAMGKVWELAQPTRRTPDAEPYDLCVMDAPASGHATTILGAPAQFAATARVGPVARQGRTIATTIEDPALTAVVSVSTAEELPVSEALELQETLAELGLPVVLGVANGMLADRFDAAERATLDASRSSHPAIVAARTHAHRAHDQQRQLARLRRDLRAPVISLPAAAVRAIGPFDVATLADRLDAGLRRLAAHPADTAASPAAPPSTSDDSPAADVPAAPSPPEDRP